jgi:DNA replication and repair protein RecF
LLAQLSCRSFRNLTDTDWRLQPGCHLLLGANGAGKTSLLEAIYLLATTRSFRTSQLEDCVRWGGERFHLRGEFEGTERVFLEVGWEASGRYRAVNGASAPLASHLGVQPTVSWAAADHEILSGQPNRRRRFLDQGVVGLKPAALAVLAHYRRALSQKRELLSVGGRGLGPWNEVLAGAITELVGLRQQYVDLLRVALRQTVAATGVALPAIDVRYRPSVEADGGADQVLARLAEVGARERAEKRALLGPHRDELEVLWGDRPARRVASAGERKLVGLVLTIARGRLLEEARRPPIYLLDDADAELDRERLEVLWPLLAGASQVFVSSNRPVVWEGISGATRWSVAGGEVGPEQG